MTGSALGRCAPIDTGITLVKQSKQVLLPAHCAICALVILGKITQAILAALWAFIVQNTFGGMIHVIKQNNTSFRQGERSGGAAAPTPKGAKGARPHQSRGAKRGRQPPPPRGAEGARPQQTGGASATPTERRGKGAAAP